jgi:hypothetical protein
MIRQYYTSAHWLALDLLTHINLNQVIGRRVLSHYNSIVTCVAETSLNVKYKPEAYQFTGFGAQLYDIFAFVVNIFPSSSWNRVVRRQQQIVL